MSKTIENIRSARSVKDLERELKKINISVSSSITKIHTLAKSSKRLSIKMKNWNSFSAVPTKATDEDIKISHTGVGKLKLTTPSDESSATIKVSFKPPKITSVKEHSDIIDGLYNNSMELDSIESFLVQTFDGYKGQPAALKGVRELQKTVDATLQKSFESLNQIAESALPPEVRSFSEVLTKQLIDTLEKDSYDNLMQSTYCSYVKDTDGKFIWVFTHYITIENLKNESGYVFDDYNVVLTVKIDNTKQATYFLTTLSDFRLPGKFPQGKRVTNTKDVRSVLSVMLRYNDVIGVLDKKQLPINTEKAKGMLAIPGVKDAVVEEDTLIVKLTKKNATTADLNSIKSVVMPLLNSLVGNKRGKSVIASKYVPKAKFSELHFILVNSLKDTSSGLNTDKLMDLKHALDLSDSEVEAIKMSLKHD